MFLVDECSDCKRKVICLLDQIFPEYNKLFLDTFGVTSSELMHKNPTPEDILSVSATKLTNFISKCSNGRFGKEKALQIKDAATNSFGVKFAADAFAFQIRQMLEQISFIEIQLDELEAQITTILLEENQAITAIPGIGNVLGAIIISEIGDISRFAYASKLVAFASLDVSVKQSGEFIGTQNKISKRGYPTLEELFGLLPAVPPSVILFSLITTIL